MSQIFGFNFNGTDHNPHLKKFRAPYWLYHEGGRKRRGACVGVAYGQRALDAALAQANNGRRVLETKKIAPAGNIRVSDSSPHVWAIYVIV